VKLSAWYVVAKIREREGEFGLLSGPHGCKQDALDDAEDFREVAREANDPGMPVGAVVIARLAMDFVEVPDNEPDVKE